MEIADPLLFSAGSAGARPVAACAVAGRSAGDSATRPRQSTSFSLSLFFEATYLPYSCFASKLCTKQLWHCR